MIFSLQSNGKTVKYAGLQVFSTERHPKMITVIINPIAGSGHALTVGSKIGEMLKERGVEHTLEYTQGIGHATRLARAATERGADTVLSVGGDGTLSEIAAGLVNTRTTLGIIPAGTGNDFVKAIGTPRKWEDALEYALIHPALPLDTGVINDSFFINVCGTGFDVMVLEYALTAKKYARGLLPYLYGVIAAIHAYKPFAMTVEIGDDIKLQGEYMLCSVANGRYIGGGIPILPVAKVDDGLLDIMVVDTLPRWRIPFYLPSLMGGSLMKKKMAHHYRAAKCSITSPGMRVNLDGEIVPMPSAHFEVRPASLLVHWPGKA
jgi:diacylglycerol kinase (ATP)